jgi:hypothetical protein
LDGIGVFVGKTGMLGVDVTIIIGVGSTTIGVSEEEIEVS